MDCRMMIKIENISKIYRLGEHGFLSDTARDAVAGKFSNIFKRAAKMERKRFYALKNVNLNVEQGETIGIVGSNGSGKSTLLKILARVTFPTAGTVSLFGRVGALLEVGAGFDQDLTGRENVFLGGVMLGMTIREVRAKYDEIVAFAEVEKFIETKVKYYSSGMYMRLAFSVAAHFEPEILLLDEILAVGDVEFQKRCRTKIRELNERGLTVLLVSHDLEKLPQICRRAVWLEAGELKMDDSAKKVKAAFMQSVAEKV